MYIPMSNHYIQSSFVVHNHKRPAALARRRLKNWVRVVVGRISGTRSSAWVAGRLRERVVPLVVGGNPSILGGGGYCIVYRFSHLYTPPIGADRGGSSGGR